MSRHSPGLLSLLLLLVLLPAVMTYSTTHAEETRPVVALYFAWYEMSDWSSGLMSDLPQQPYSCGDRATLQRQVQQAHDAGIDAFMVAWTGQEDSRIDGRVRQLLDLAGQYGFKIAVFLDITASGNFRTAEQVRDNLQYVLNIFVSHPNYLRFNHRPVIGFWALPSVATYPGKDAYGTWQQLRQELDPGHTTFWLGEGVNFDYLDIFDGIYFFDITWAAEPGSAMASYARKLDQYNSAHGSQKPFIATVMPGYDDTRMPGRPTHYRDRANGEYYARSWQAAIDRQAAMVIITSWNEWYEGSHIEPSQNYGTQYLDLTRQWVPQFKGANPPAPTQPPLPTPVPGGTFADSAFEAVWRRTDKPVADGRTVRSWVWGPAPFSGAIYEPYAQSPGGIRLVQYFDKSRMEINNPYGDRSSMWFVTNGLLVWEMVTGRLMTGDASFETRDPSGEAVAGDWATVNPDCPTYASFAGLIGRPASPRLGQKVTATLARDGTVGENTGMGYAGTEIAYYEPVTGHNVPRVLWDFMNRSGLIYEGGSYRNGRIVDWLFAMGYPISEPYWVRCRVAGEEKDILVQLFERRVLTYTPSNPAGWQVEMGNVGLHYYRWRYGQ